MTENELRWLAATAKGLDDDDDEAVDAERAQAWAQAVADLRAWVADWTAMARRHVGLRADLITLGVVERRAPGTAPPRRGRARPSRAKAKAKAKGRSRARRPRVGR